jgi:predicted Zn-dependent peptidase
VVPGVVHLDGAEARHNDPAWGVTSLDLELLPPELDAALAGMAARLGQTVPADPDDSSGANDPQARLERHFRDALGLQGAGVSGQGEAGNAVVPLLVVVSGDVEPGAVLWAVAQAYGDFPPAGSAGKGGSGAGTAQPGAAVLNESGRMEVESTLEQPVAQEQLGYVAPAPGPAEPAAAPWRMALYLLTHGYEGRLGREAISKRGLVYYIDSAYHSDGRRGWVTLSMGVDPDKLPAMRELLRSELARLVSEPPTQADLDEARRHLLGRQLSAAQSNGELADRLARDWLWYGELPGYEDLREQLERVTLQDLLAVLPAFTAGSIVAVRNPSARAPASAH